MKGRANPSLQTGGWFSDRCERAIKPKVKKVTETEELPKDGKKPNGEETGNDTDGGEGAVDDEKQKTTYYWRGWRRDRERDRWR